MLSYGIFITIYWLGILETHINHELLAVGIHVAGGATSNTATRINYTAYELFKKYRSW